MDISPDSGKLPTWGPVTDILQHIKNIQSGDAVTHQSYDSDGGVDIAAALNQLPSLQCFASEKIHGTPLSKDDSGKVLHPPWGDLRCHCSVCYQARSKDVGGVKHALIQKCQFDAITPSDFCLTLTGQVAISDKYLYRERGFHGDWRVFGAIVTFKKQDIQAEFLSKVLDAGFLAKISTPGTVKIYQNAEFCHLLSSKGFSTPRVFKVPQGKRSLSALVDRARKYMAHGRIHGLILTLQDKNLIQLKWESAKNIPRTELDNVLKLHDDIQAESLDAKLWDMVGALFSVSTYFVRNQLTIQEDHLRRIAFGKENQVVGPSCISPTDSIILTYETKLAIWVALTYSTSKFDNIVSVMRRDEDHIGQYYWFLAKETRLRYSEVMCRHWDTVSSDDRVMKYINLVTQRYSACSLGRHLSWKRGDPPLEPILFNTCTFDGQDDPEDVATPDCDGLCRDRDCDFHLIF